MTNFHAEIIRLAVFCSLTVYLWHLARKHAATSDPGWTFMFRGLGLVFLGLLVSITEDFPQLNGFIVLGNTRAEAFIKNGLMAVGFITIAMGVGKVLPSLGRLRRVEAELTDYQTELEQKIMIRTAELAKSEERYRTMVESLQDPYYEVDLNGNFTYVNVSLCNTVEMAEEAVLGESYRILFDEQDARAVSEIFNKMYTSGIRPRPQEWKIKTRSGGYRWCEISLDLAKDPTSNVLGFKGVSRDITDKRKAEEDLRKAHDELEERVQERTAQLVEANAKLTTEIDHRKEIEKELRESRERLQMAIETTELGLWDMNIQTGESLYDQRTLATIEFTSEEASPTLDFWGSRCHPEDLYQMRKAFNAHFKGITPLYHSEYRILAKSGNWKWVASHGMVVERDAMGNPLRMEGTILDITDRNESEELLKANVREKEVLLREIHHRVKNNLQLMGSMLALQSISKKGASVADVLKDAERRIWAMALVHETLYRSGDLGRRLGSEYFQRLLEDFQAGQGGLAWQIRLEKEIEDVSLSLDSAINCGLIMNELISNSIKHAFPEGAEGRVEVSLRSLADGQTELAVSDDGVGLPEGFELEKVESFGFDLVKMLVDELGGTMEFIDKGGTEVRIRF